MEPKAFLDLADDLKNKSDSEAALRTSVSRSYYALHNFLSQFIKNEGFILPKAAEKHELVYYWLHNCGITYISQIAKQLDDLREGRNDADYDLEVDKFQNPNVAVLLFFKARSAYNSFEKYVRNSSNRKKIKEGIREYQKKAPS